MFESQTVMSIPILVQLLIQIIYLTVGIFSRTVSFYDSKDSGEVFHVRAFCGEGLRFMVI